MLKILTHFTYQIVFLQCFEGEKAFFVSQFLRDRVQLNCSKIADITFEDFIVRFINLEKRSRSGPGSGPLRLSLCIHFIH